ncbi:MAG: hypothetical protein RDU14_10725 [Melioribacteraceae bacterium]|jgi:cell division protein FtsL|nr:hypothetical protein [Melioribacteraceae bacterium]
MKKITDEILNDYIDNQLDTAALKEVNELLQSDEEGLKKLKSLKVVDQSLTNMEVYPAPEGFTKRMMSRIIAHSKTMVPKVSYFFIVVVSLLSVGIISVLVTAYITAEKTADGANKLSVLDSVLKYIKDYVPAIQKFLSNQNILTIGMVLTMILLISGYFMLESHKNFKNKLNNLPSRS